MITRTETAPHNLRVGDKVRLKSAAIGECRYFRVTGFLPYDGSGLEIVNGLAMVESLAIRPVREIYGWGALERVG